MVLLRFLFDFALPWLALRQGIRCNHRETLDSMWAITLPWFRAAGKSNYSTMAVDVLYTNCSLSGPLRKIWFEQCTMSLSGNMGCQVAYDGANEEMNKLLKCGLGTGVAPHLIDPYILMLNGIREVSPRLKQMFESPNQADQEDDKAAFYTQYSRTEQGDVDAIVQALSNTLGTSAAKLFENRTSNPFRTGAGVPWTRVAEQAGSMADYINSQLDTPFKCAPV